MPPSDVTASTITSAPCSRAIAATACTGFEHAGGRFRVHDRHDVRAGRLQRLPHLLGIDRASPLGFDARHLAAVARRHLRQAIGEVAGDHRQHARARRDEIRDRGFHGRRAGARHRKGERSVRRLEHARQPRPHVVHDLDELRIEMAQHRRAERLITRGDIRLGRGREGFVRCAEQRRWSLRAASLVSGRLRD